jgi:hypothetical protein
MDSPLDPDIVQHAMKVERAADQADPQNGYTPATEVRSLKPWTMFALAAGVAVVLWLGTWHWQMMMTAVLLVTLTLGPLLRWWTAHRAVCPLDHVLASYLLGLFVLSTVSTIMGLTFGMLAAAIVSPIGWVAGQAAWRLEIIVDGIARWSAFCLVEEMWLLYALRMFRRRRQHRFVENSNRAQRAYALYGAAVAVGYAATQCILLACVVTAHMDGHTVFQRGHADEGVVTASETGGLLFLSLCFAWFLLPLRLLASHLNALDLERCPDLATDTNPCLPLGNSVQGEEAPVGVSCSKRLSHMWEIIKWPWALRSAHYIQFTTFFWLLGMPITLGNIVAWLIVTFIFWAGIMYAALWRIGVVERALGQNGAAVYSANDDVTMRSLYGFALLDDEEPERVAHAGSLAPDDNGAMI